MGKQLTRSDFIERANQKHNYKYDYSLVEYINSKTNVKILCPEHGVFEQVPYSHYNGQGCIKCGGKLVFNTNDFIIQSKKIHGDKYDYSLVEYKRGNFKVNIICQEHGVFEQLPNNHLKGNGCGKCGGKILDRELFIEKSLLLHGDKYDYSLVEYKLSKLEVKIICKEHGVFEQTPDIHMRGYGCAKCSNNYNYTNQEFIEKAKNIHGDKYDYSITEYKKAHGFINIICPKHGIFTQRAYNHIGNGGCEKCGIVNRSSNIYEFIKRSKIIHGDKYDYSLVCYENMYTNINIICTKHGGFKQTPQTHLLGCGCPKCGESKGETKVRLFLENNGLEYVSQKKFKECIYKRELPFDFYLPAYNMCIEYDGEQHYIPVEKFGGIDNFNLIQLKDNIKTDYCLHNGITLIRIRFDEDVFGLLRNIFI